ncbi:MAG: Na+/H+ antiporter NhaC family protein [Prevotella sp.]|nr:Na+/H+ antiporter NhaC family protein [Prevotella sp.]
MNKKGIIALSPLAVFILLYLVTSIIAGDFYKVPITVAFLLSSIYAVIVCGGIPTRGGMPIAERISIFSRGASMGNMMLMLWIFVLAGAFANTAKVMGSIDATVNLTLSILPGNMILAGLFLAACFVSISVGTSVGTIVALTPIAAGVANSTGSSVPLLTAVIVGGSLFGDNLSFISDTTIAATSTQGCKLSDKFRVNSFLVMPVALLILGIYTFMGSGINSPQNVPEVSIIKVIPYIIVLVTAVCGMNVMAVLTLGILVTGSIGIIDGSFDVFGWFAAMGNGITGMGELIIITMMAGGMLELIKVNGGIDTVINLLTKRISTKRGAEMSIAALVGMVNVCTANNTVAIITTGGIAKQIGDRFGIDNRKCASILDTMSCCVQGVIPYGAQMLMAAGLASVNPVSIMPYLYYPYLLGAVTILAITARYPRRYS